MGNWQLTHLPVGFNLRLAALAGLICTPLRLRGEGSSGVTSIDISSAGSPSGSDGILEHGNGSCLVEKANLPQLYRISAGVLQLSPSRQPWGPAARRRKDTFL